MKGLRGLAWLLVLQVIGELLSRGFSLPLPGPVLGLVLLLAALRFEFVREPVAECAGFLLAHLSLLFIPVGVGGIAVDPPDAGTHIHILAGNADALCAVQQYPAQRALRLKPDEKHRRFPPEQIVLQMVPDASCFAHARRRHDDHARYGARQVRDAA